MCKSRFKIILCIIILLILACCFYILPKTAQNAKNITTETKQATKVSDLDHDGVADSKDKDIDGDGVSNIDEKKAGTNPLDANSKPTTLKVATEANASANATETNNSATTAKANATAATTEDNSSTTEAKTNNSTTATEANASTNTQEANATTVTEVNTSSNATEANNSANAEANTTAATTEANSSTTEAEANKKSESAQNNKANVIEEINKLLKVEHIKFDTDSSTLLPEGIETVKKIADILKKYPDAKVEIGGHTDSDGNANYNLKLSQERVDMVKKALVEFGIDANRLTTKGYGETKPLVPNTTAQNKAKNRRVEFKLIK